MNTIGKAYDNNALAAMARTAGPRVTGAIKAAAAKTGVNFAYLMEQAAAESGFNAKAGSKTSSAKGLYQFIEKTWLNMVRNHGEAHGLGKYAALIDEDGKVADPAARAEILALRNDPDKAAAMAAEFASENRTYLEKYSGLSPDEIGSTELYFAHFLGAGGAAAFLKAHRDNPLANAADLFPKAARANRNVFYDRATGEGRTLAGVYDFFAKKFKSDDAPAPQIAAAPPSASLLPAESRKPLYALFRQDMERQTSAADILLPRPSFPAARGFGAGIPALSAGQALVMAFLDMPSFPPRGR